MGHDAASTPKPAKSKRAKAAKAEPSSKRAAGKSKVAAAAEGKRAKTAGASKAPAPAKTPRSPKTPKGKQPRRLSALDAAAHMLAKSDVPMRATEMLAAMLAKGLWSSPGGKTPEATLYAAIIRENAAMGTKARFKKHERGVFVATSHAGKEA